MVLQGPLTLPKYIEDLKRDTNDAMDVYQERQREWVNAEQCIENLLACRKECRRLLALGQTQESIVEGLLVVILSLLTHIPCRQPSTLEIEWFC